MGTATKLITADELWLMPSDQRRELVRGEIRTMAPAGFDHGATMSAFQFALHAFVRANKLGVVVGGETGFKLAKDPDTVRGVDVGFVKASRIPASGRPVKFFDGAPDLAVEVLSPSDTADEVEEKIEDYLRAGTEVVVTISPRSKTVTLHRQDQNPEVFRHGDTLTIGEPVPGFSCPVADIFA